MVLTWDPQTQGRSDGPGGPAPRTRTPAPDRPRRSPRAPWTRSTSSCPPRGRPSGRATAARCPPSTTPPSRTGAWPRARTPPSTRSTPRLDPKQIGIAGNSLGAFAVSKVGVRGHPRGRRGGLGPAAVTARTGTGGHGRAAHAAGARPRHVGRLRDRVAQRRRRGDPEPRDSRPGPAGRQRRRRGPSARRGVPTMQVNTRAGTHFESAVIPNAGLPRHAARDRPVRLVHARLVRPLREGRRRAPTAGCSPTAGRGTPLDAKVDPAGEGNLFSANLRSRIDIVTPMDGAGAVRGPAHGLRDPGATTAPARSRRADFGFGRQTLAPGAPAPRCASAVRAPRRLDLSRSKRRLPRASAAEASAAGWACT